MSRRKGSSNADSTRSLPRDTSSTRHGRQHTSVSSQTGTASTINLPSEIGIPNRDILANQSSTNGESVAQRDAHEAACYRQSIPEGLTLLAGAALDNAMNITLGPERGAHEKTESDSAVEEKEPPALYPSFAPTSLRDKLFLDDKFTYRRHDEKDHTTHDVSSSSSTSSLSASSENGTHKRHRSNKAVSIRGWLSEMHLSKNETQIEALKKTKLPPGAATEQRAVVHLPSRSTNSEGVQVKPNLSLHDKDQINHAVSSIPEGGQCHMQGCKAIAVARCCV